MPQSLRTCRARRIALASLAVVLAGCAAKQGKYTTEHKEKAQEKVAQMKSATEWDMARQAYLAGDLKKALSHVDRSIALNETVAKSHVLRGRILMELNEFNAALSALARAEEIAAADVDAQYFTGLCHERIAQKEKALARYVKAGELEPGTAKYAVAAAEMLIDLGRLDEAQAHLTAREDTFQNDPGVKQTLGHVAMLRGRPTDAVVLFTEARLLAPDDQAVFEDLARAQLAAGNFPEAEYSLAMLLKNPQNSARRDLRHAHARCLLQVGRPMEARDLLISLTGDAEGAKDIESWIELGQTCRILQDTTRLKQCASRVVALAPHRHEGYVLKALWERLSGHPESALSSLDRAVQRAPDDVPTLLLHAITARDCAKPQLAARSLARARALDPANSAVLALSASIDGTALANQPSASPALDQP